MENAKAKLVLFCGLPGSGKTTLAKKLAGQYHAVRLCTDEWVADLGFDPNDEEVHHRMQRRLWELGKEMLRLGHVVIVEDGLWTKLERDNKRKEAAELGVPIEMHYLKVPLEELIRRLESRNSANQHGHAQVTKEDMEKFYEIFQPPDSDELALFSNVLVHE